MDENIEIKAIKIIESCSKKKHFEVARKFVELINNEKLTEKLNSMIGEKELLDVIEEYGCISEFDFQKTIFKLKINKGFENNIDNIHSLLNEIEVHTGFKKVVKLHISKNNFNIIIKK